MLAGDKIEARQEEGGGPFPPGKIMTVAREVANALEYLHHEVHLLHGDIKSYNILLSNDWKLVKVCDFGVSVPLNKDLQMDDSKKDVVYTGTKCWNAPEVIFGKDFCLPAKNIPECGQKYAQRDC